jgi:hypothetical protein
MFAIRNMHQYEKNKRLKYYEEISRPEDFANDEEPAVP